MQTTDRCPAARRACRPLLALSAAELPSRQGAGRRAPRARRSGPPHAGAGAQRIAQLEAELAQASVAEGLQYRLDGLQARLAALEEALKGGDKLREGLERRWRRGRSSTGASARGGARRSRGEARRL